MVFPETAKKAIADVFYDKDVAILDKQEVLDDEGGVVKSGETVKCTFKGNVRFMALTAEQSSLGLVKRGDIQITCPTDTAVEVDDLLQYAGVKYIVLSALPSSSHLTIVGERCQKQ